MANPKVTAVITTHNRLNLLKKAINSVKEQSYDNIELIVVNDKSTDGTKEYLDHLDEEKVLKHIWISEKESKGGNYARNKGIKNSLGEFVTFLDDDDEWFPTKIEKQVKLLLQYPEVGMVYCGKRVETNFSEYRDVIQDDWFRGDLREKCFIRVFCSTSMIMVKKDLLYNVGLFDEDLGYWQEYDLCIRLSECTKIDFVPEPLILYRIITTDNARLTNHIDGWENAVRRIEMKYQNRLQNLNKDIKTQWILNKYYDGAERSNSANLPKKKRYYLWKIFTITHKPKHLIRCMLNTTLPAKEFLTSVLTH